MLRMRKKTVTVRDGMICDACEIPASSLLYLQI